MQLIGGTVAKEVKNEEIKTQLYLNMLPDFSNQKLCHSVSSVEK